MTEPQLSKDIEERFDQSFKNGFQIVKNSTPKMGETLEKLIKRFLAQELKATEERVREEERARISKMVDCFVGGPPDQTMEFYNGWESAIGKILVALLPPKNSSKGKNG